MAGFIFPFANGEFGVPGIFDPQAFECSHRFGHGESSALERPRTRLGFWSAIPLCMVHLIAAVLGVVYTEPCLLFSLFAGGGGDLQSLVIQTALQGYFWYVLNGLSAFSGGVWMSMECFMAILSSQKAL